MNCILCSSYRLEHFCFSPKWITQDAMHEWTSHIWMSNNEDRQVCSQEFQLLFVWLSKLKQQLQTPTLDLRKPLKVPATDKCHVWCLARFEASWHEPIW